MPQRSARSSGAELTIGNCTAAYNDTQKHKKPLPTTNQSVEKIKYFKEIPEVNERLIRFGHVSQSVEILHNIPF
jgi:hypothetical protein